MEDQAFHYCIEGLQDLYNNGRLNFEVYSLMETALNKYKMLVEAKRWNAPTAQDAQIVALTALIKKNAVAPKKKKESKKKDNKKKPKTKNSNEWAWKDKPPKDGKSKTTKFRKKTYHWCPKHSAWTIHSPSECTLPAAVAPKATKTKATANKLTNSLVSIIENESNEDNK